MDYKQELKELLEETNNFLIAADKDIISRWYDGEEFVLQQNDDEEWGFIYKNCCSSGYHSSKERALIEELTYQHYHPLREDSGIIVMYGRIHLTLENYKQYFLTKTIIME